MALALSLYDNWTQLISFFLVLHYNAYQGTPDYEFLLHTSEPLVPLMCCDQKYFSSIFEFRKKEEKVFRWIKFMLFYFPPYICSYLDLKLRK